MKREPPFSSSLALVFHRYLELKRALGCTFSVERRVLHSLDRLLADPSNNSSDLTSRTFQQWCRTHETVASAERRTRRRTIYNFCLYGRRTDADSFLPYPLLCRCQHPRT